MHALFHVPGSPRHTRGDLPVHLVLLDTARIHVTACEDEGPTPLSVSSTTSRGMQHTACQRLSRHAALGA